MRPEEVSGGEKRRLMSPQKRVVSVDCERSSRKKFKSARELGLTL